MSCNIVSNETISVLAKAFVDYGVDYRADNYHPQKTIIIMMNTLRQEIGQSLLEQNYKSYNYRYREENSVPVFNYTDLEIDEGLVYGCIRDFCYQASENPDWEHSDCYYSLKDLQEQLLKRLLKKAGQKAPYGYGGFDLLEN